MKQSGKIYIGSLLVALVFVLSACGPTANQVKPQKTVTVDKDFQSELTSLPSQPEYVCGAWSSSNGPSPYSIITIYARLTKDITGVAGSPAQATVHFAYGDATITQKPISDSGGYVTFTLPLEGRQPRLLAATVSVTFTVNGNRVNCSQAFFTPQ